MNRRTVLGLTTAALLCTGVVFSASQAPAQKSLKDQLVGAWTLVSSVATAPNGTTEQFYGPNPKGIMILDASGRYAQVQGRSDRPKLKTANRFELDATAAELKTVLLGFAANTGSWSVNEADKTLIRRYESALVPNNEGSEQKAIVTLTGDELKLTQVSPTSRVRTDAVYRRAK